MNRLRSTGIWLCSIGFWFIDTTVQIYKPRRNNELKLLLIVRLDAIGDYVLWSRSVNALRKLFPKSEWSIELAANSDWASLASLNSLFDSVIAINRTRLLTNPVYRIKVLRQIRQRGYEIALQPTFSRETYWGDALVRASGAPQRIGSSGDISNMPLFLKRLADRAYTKLIPAAASVIHESIRNEEFLRGLGLIQSLRCEKLEIGDTAILQNEALGFAGIEQYFVIIPSASKQIKEWPADRFAEIASRLADRYGWTGVVCGGPNDVDTANQVCQSASTNMLNLSGRTDLIGYAVILSGARLVVTNDTSAVHIAAARGVPSVCVVGGGHFGRFLPYPFTENGGIYPQVVHAEMSCYGCNWHCIHLVAPGKPKPCIDKVSIEAVWNACKVVLEKEACATATDEGSTPA